MFKPEVFRTILILSLLFISYRYGYTDSSLVKEKGKLSHITKELNEKKSILNQLIREEKNTLTKLSVLEKDIKSGGEKINDLKIQLAKVDKDICQTQRNVYTANREFKKRQDVFLKRLNAIYKYRGGDLFEILFNADNFADLSKQLYFMTLIAQADTKLIEGVKIKRDIYMQQEKILQSEYKKVDKIKRTQQNLLDKQKRLKKEREEFLRKIYNEKSLYQQRIAKLERDSLAIQQLIKKLEATKLPISKEILRGSGNLPWPVKNKIIYRGFGKYKHPKFDAYAVNKGIDILSPAGETVTSIKEGQVAFANWFKGYGMLIMIDHGQGLYSLYANLAHIFVSVGEKVDKGTPLGKLGDPGFENYNFHFEIRVNGKPANPLSWLRGG